MCLILDGCWHSSSKPRGTGRHASVGAVLPVQTLCSGMDSFSKKRRNGKASSSFSTHSTRLPLLEAHVSHFRIFFFPFSNPVIHVLSRAHYPKGPPAAGKAAHVGQPCQGREDDTPSAEGARARAAGPGPRISPAGATAWPLGHGTLPSDMEHNGIPYFHSESRRAVRAPRASVDSAPACHASSGMGGGKALVSGISLSLSLFLPQLPLQRIPSPFHSPRNFF